MQTQRRDVMDLRVVRRVEQHPQAWRVWQPVIIPPQTPEASHCGLRGDGLPARPTWDDILATLSTDDGDTWEEPVTIFDHRRS